MSIIGGITIFTLNSIIVSSCSPKSDVSIKIGLSDFANASTILLCIITLLSVIVAYNAFKDSKKRKARENAVQLAHYFQESIMPKMQFATVALKDTDAQKKIIAYFPSADIHDFDVTELKMLSDKENIVEEINALVIKIPIANLTSAKLSSLKTASDVTNTLKYFSGTVWLPNVIVENDQTGKKSAEYKKARNSAVNNAEFALRQELSNTLLDLLNVLEWLAMNFTTGIADEKVVYQSLHQAFLSNIYQLYFFISVNNKTDAEKFYTNIISLFTLWTKRKECSLEIESKERSRYNLKKCKATFKNRPLK